MGGYNEDYASWSYDSGTRLWNDGTGNTYHSLPVGIDPKMIGMTKSPSRRGWDLPSMYKGPFTVSSYAKFIRRRLRGITFIGEGEVYNDVI